MCEVKSSSKRFIVHKYKSATENLLALVQVEKRVWGNVNRWYIHYKKKKYAMYRKERYETIIYREMRYQRKKKKNMLF